MPYRTESSSFQLSLNQLQEALSWLQGLGIRTKSTRLDAYLQTMKRMIDVVASVDVKTADNELETYVNALFEVHEFLEIYHGLGDGSYDSDLIDYLNDVRAGPVYAKQENVSSGNRPRNLAFELLMNSRFSRGGLAPNLSSNADAECSIGGNTVVIECKRPSSVRQIERRIDEAHQQLAKHYESRRTAGLRGAIAIDISKIANPKQLSMRYESATDVNAQMEGILDAFDDQYCDALQRKMHKKTIGAFVRMAAMAKPANPGGVLVYCQEFGVFAYKGHPQRHRDLMNILHEALQTGFKVDSGARTH